MILMTVGAFFSFSSFMFPSVVKLRSWALPRVGATQRVTCRGVEYQEPFVDASMAAALAACAVVLWLVTQHWLFVDLLGVALASEAIRTLRLPNFGVATALLGVFFLYDIFWVFISPLLFTKSVMVEVALGTRCVSCVVLAQGLCRRVEWWRAVAHVDPGAQDLVRRSGTAGAGRHCVARALALAAVSTGYRQSESRTASEGGATRCSVGTAFFVPCSFSRNSPRLFKTEVLFVAGLVYFVAARLHASSRCSLEGYFSPALLAYVIGLIITLAALAILQMGQPALLYLVPCTVGITALLAWLRGEVCITYNCSSCWL